MASWFVDVGVVVDVTLFLFSLLSCPFNRKHKKSDRQIRFCSVERAYAAVITVATAEATCLLTRMEKQVVNICFER